jgi:hypothetical protein
MQTQLLLGLLLGLALRPFLDRVLDKLGERFISTDSVPHLVVLGAFGLLLVGSGGYVLYRAVTMLPTALGTVMIMGGCISTVFSVIQIRERRRATMSKR